MKKICSKILLVLIVCLIIIICFFITDYKFNITGKPIHVVDNIQTEEEIPTYPEQIPYPTDPAEIIPPTCKLEIESPQYISTEKRSVYLRIIYSTNMNTNYIPEISLVFRKTVDIIDPNHSFSDTDYHLEDSEWVNNQEFRTKLVFTKDNVFIDRVYFVIKGAILDYEDEKIQQETFYSSIQDIYITIDTQKPKLEQIYIVSDRKKSISQMTFVFDKELVAINCEINLLNQKEEENIKAIIDAKYKNKIIAETKFLDEESIIDHALKIKPGTVQDNYENKNDDIFILFNKYENYKITFLPEEIIAIENYLNIESFDLLVASNRAAITFEEKIYSNTNKQPLTKANFKLYKNNNLVENGIKEVSHITDGLFVVLLFNEIISDTDEYSVDVINAYDEYGSIQTLEKKITGIDNSTNQQKYLPLIKGWNLVSIDSYITSQFPDNLSDDQDVETFVYFNDNWQSVRITKGNKATANYSAFFIKSSIPQKLFLPNTTELEKFNIDNLSEGWNLVGFSKYTNNAFVLDDIITETNGAIIILKGTSNYNLTDVAYTINNSNQEPPILSPFDGYWIYKENGVIE